MPFPLELAPYAVGNPGSVRAKVLKKDSYQDGHESLPNVKPSLEA